MSVSYRLLQPELMSETELKSILQSVSALLNVYCTSETYDLKVLQVAYVLS